MTDEKFDRLLAKTEQRATPPPGPCPDAGVLAALLDRTLDRSERREVERHVAACARCALQLATLSRLEEEAGEHADRPAPVWWRQWQWAIPVVTVVLAVGLWITVPRDIDDRLPPAAPAVPVAETSGAAGVRQAAPVEDADKGAEPVPKSRPESARTPGSEAVPSGPGRSADAAGRALSKESMQDAQAPPDAPAPERFHDEVKLQRQEAGPHREAEARFKAAAPESPPGEVAQRAVPPTAAATEASESVVGGAAARRAVGDEAARQPLSAAGLLVPSPQAAVRWRVQDGRIERTGNAGRTWQSDHAAPIPGLRVGAAPAPDVCWLAGAGGLVLRRDPSGVWTRVPLPEPLDIHAIAATSSLEATVTTAEGGRFQTTDGGRTWLPQD